MQAAVIGCSNEAAIPLATGYVPRYTVQTCGAPVPPVRARRPVFLGGVPTGPRLPLLEIARFCSRTFTVQSYRVGTLQHS